MSPKKKTKAKPDEFIPITIDAPEDRSSEESRNHQMRCAIVNGLLSRYGTDISKQWLRERVDKYMEVMGE